MRAVRRVALGALWLFLAFAYGGAYLEHLRLAADPFAFNDDARAHLPPLFLPSDTIGEYYLRTHLTPGFKAWYGLASWFADPVVFSKFLPYPLLAIALALIAAVSRRLGSGFTAWASVALALSSALFLDRMTGGLSRAFAFPIAALALYGIVAGKSRAAGAATLLGAACYPPVGVLSGVALAIVALLPERMRGDLAGWSPGRRLAGLAAVAALSVAMLLPQWLAGREYGPRLTAADAAAYPETGEGGRYGVEDRPPYPHLLQETAASVYRSLIGGGEGWFRPLDMRRMGLALGNDLLLLAVSALYFGFLGWRGERAALQRLGAFAAAIALCHGMALLAAPYAYLPQRFVLYALPVLLLAALPCAFRNLALKRRWGARPGAADAAAVAITLLFLVFFGGRGQGDAGYTVRVAESERPLHAFLAALPADARIAGWPQGAMDNVPYLARKPVLMNYETHQALHRDYADLMRRRFECLLRGYASGDGEGVRQAFEPPCAATHLVVEKRLLQAAAPGYFLPFDAQVRERWAKGMQTGFAVESLPAVYEDARFRVLALTP